MKSLDVIIIGAGISGLACAKTLSQHGFQDFLLLSNNIGGRICSSTDGQVNYGAYYVRRDYHHVLGYVRLTRSLRSRSVFLYQDNEICPLGRSIKQHPIMTARLLWHLHRFDRRYQLFKKRGETESQREVIESDVLLNELFHQDAVEFLHQHRLDCLMDCLINPIVWGTALVDVREVSASTMLFLLLILIHPTFEFEFLANRLTATFSGKIKLDEVVSVKRSGNSWQVETRQGSAYRARNVVVAMPIDAAKALLDLDCEINPPVNAHLIHVQGKLRSPFDRARYVVLAPQTREIVLAQQADGTQIFYSRSPDIELSKYLSQWHIIDSKSWCPAFHVGKRLIESQIRDNMYLIGDHNAVSLEDAFITGIYAANQLTGSNKTATRGRLPRKRAQ